MSNCLSEVSYSLTNEESRERSYSFTSRERMRSFLRTAYKIRQEDKVICLSEVSYSLTTEGSHERSYSFTSRERMRSFLRTAYKIRQEDKKWEKE
jgi:hypothetical protein